MIDTILHALIPILLIVISGRMLFLALKYGAVGSKIFKKEQPVRYWIFVVCYAGIFVGALWLLILAVHYCFLVANLPKPPNQATPDR